MAKGNSYAASQLFMGLTPKNGFKASKLYCYKPIDGSGDFSWSRNHTAYRLNQSGNLELMGNNVPRIDYTNTCPELLIEGERTNLSLRSQEFDNASWIKDGTTITANSIDAPNGTTTADKVIEDTNNAVHAVAQGTSFGLNNYTFSVYAKYAGRQYIMVRLLGPSSGYFTAMFDIQNGLIGNINTANTSANIEDAGNGWYRCSITGNTDLFNAVVFLSDINSTSPIAVSYTGDGTSGAYLWGAQLEQGSYVSSYITTTNASVTRPQDTNSSNIAFTGDGFSYNLRVRLENRSDAGTPDNIFFIEDFSGTSDTYAGVYVLGDSLYFTFYNNPDTEEYSITLPDGIHNLGVSLDCTNGNYEIVVDGVSEFSGTLSVGFNGANIYERVKLGCLAASTDSIGLNRIIGLQVYDAVLTQGELIEYTTA
jgi:hypothetical protein